MCESSKWGPSLITIDVAESDDPTKKCLAWFEQEFESVKACWHGRQLVCIAASFTFHVIITLWELRCWQTLFQKKLNSKIFIFWSIISLFLFLVEARGTWQERGFQRTMRWEVKVMLTGGCGGCGCDRQEVKFSSVSFRWFAPHILLFWSAKNKITRSKSHADGWIVAGCGGERQEVKF